MNLSYGMLDLSNSNEGSQSRVNSRKHPFLKLQYTKNEVFEDYVKPFKNMKEFINLKQQVQLIGPSGSAKRAIAEKYKAIRFRCVSELESQDSINIQDNEEEQEQDMNEIKKQNLIKKINENCYKSQLNKARQSISQKIMDILEKDAARKEEKDFECIQKSILLSERNLSKELANQKSSQLNKSLSQQRLNRQSSLTQGQPSDRSLIYQNYKSETDKLIKIARKQSNLILQNSFDSSKVTSPSQSPSKILKAKVSQICAETTKLLKRGKGRWKIVQHKGDQPQNIQSGELDSKNSFLSQNSEKNANQNLQLSEDICESYSQFTAKMKEKVERVDKLNTPISLIKIPQKKESVKRKVSIYDNISSQQLSSQPLQSQSLSSQAGYSLQHNNQVKLNNNCDNNNNKNPIKFQSNEDIQSGFFNLSEPQFQQQQQQQQRKYLKIQVPPYINSSSNSFSINNLTSLKDHYLNSQKEFQKRKPYGMGYPIESLSTLESEKIDHKIRNVDVLGHKKAMSKLIDTIQNVQVSEVSKDFHFTSLQMKDMQKQLSQQFPDISLKDAVEGETFVDNYIPFKSDRRYYSKEKSNHNLDIRKKSRRSSRNSYDQNISRQLPALQKGQSVSVRNN